MRRSKLETHIDVLETLAQHGPLKLTHIMYTANVNCSILKQCLDLLIRHHLVEEQTLHRKRFIYAITERGKTALQRFTELNSALHIIEETKIPESPY